MNAPTGADPRLPLPIGWTPADTAPADGVAGATATVVPVRVVGQHGTPGWLFTVTGDVGNAVRKRLRTEQPALDALLRSVAAEPAGSVLLPWVEYGDPKASRPYLVCPRPGPTFADDLLRGPMPASRVVNTALVCVDALHLLHRHGRAHGLLAPQSLHHDGGRVRLSAPLPPALAELVALAGGTGHEPPEVLRGGDADAAADVFGLASTCWTLLSGRPPFGPVGDQLARLTAAEPPPLSRADVPSAMEAALRAALSPDPARRPDLRTLAQALRIVDGGAAPVSEVAPPAHAAAPSGPEDPGARLDTLAPTRPVTDAGRPLGSRYLLDSLIGRGATGHVWRGHVRDDGSPVAVKLLRPELAEDPEVVTRFMRERAALMRLSHPHLVGIHDLVAEGGALAIVMDFVDGRDLRAVLASGPLAPADAARLLGQTADALSAVHAAGIIHRDLKPENVLVEPSGGTTRARLTDFGLARAVESSVLTRMTQLVGTPAYVAPEVVAGRDPGPAVDVYALGITAYELLAGRRPFAMTSTAALLHAHLDAVPQRPEGLTDEVWALIAACLDKDPARRPSASAVARAWSSVAVGGPAGAVATPASMPMPMPTPTPAGAGYPIETPLRQYAGPAPVLPGAPTPDELRSSTGVQETTTTDRPLAPRHSGPAPEGRDRRRLWWALAAAVVVLGFGGGFGVVALGGDDKPAPEAAEQPYYYLTPTFKTSQTGLAVQWTVPNGAVSENSVFFVQAFANGKAGRPRNTSPLPSDQRSFNDGSLRAGQCVAVYILNPAVKAPTPNLSPIPKCAPKATPTGSPSK